MRALTMTAFTGPDGLAVAEVPDPGPPGRDEVLVAVTAGGIGAWDLGSADGAFRALGGNAELPQVAGWDFAGTVAAAGSAVDGLRVGDPVLGFTPQPWSGCGAFAELIRVPAGAVALRPDGLDVHEAALLPVAALTARLLLDTARASVDSRVLVTGAAGAVGGLVVQLGAAEGAVVIAATAAAAEQQAARRGAAHVVDRAGDVSAQVRSIAPGGVDAAIDLTGDPAVRVAAIASLRDGGVLVTAVRGGDPGAPRDIAVRFVQVQPDGAALAPLAALAAAGVLRPLLGHVLPLAEGARGYRAMRDRSVRGRVVLEVAR